MLSGFIIRHQHHTSKLLTNIKLIMSFAQVIEVAVEFVGCVTQQVGGSGSGNGNGNGTGIGSYRSGCCGADSR